MFVFFIKKEDLLYVIEEADIVLFDLFHFVDSSYQANGVTTDVSTVTGPVIFR